MTRPQAAPPRRRRDDRGSAMLIVVLVTTMLLMLAMTVTMVGSARSRVAIEDRIRTDLLLAADSGLALKAYEINASAGSDLANRTYQVADGTVTVTVTDCGNNGVDDDNDGTADGSKEQGIVRIVSTAESTRRLEATPLRRTIEAFLRSEHHPLFFKAVFVGNQQNQPGYTLVLGPGSDGKGATPTRNPPAGKDNAKEDNNGTTLSDGLESGRVNNADFVDGDVYVNGDVHVRGQTNLYGDVSTTGDAKGRPVTGTTETGADPITPPDLAAMDYDALADWVVSVSDPTPYNGSKNNTTNYVTGVTTGADGIPSFLKYGPWTSATDHFHQDNSANFERPNFHFGADSNPSLATLDFSSVAGADGTLGTADDQTVFVVKGNLWIDTRGTTYLNFPNAPEIQITVVVEGNIYISDQLSYKGGNDAILFIAKGTDDDPNTSARENESFIDGSDGSNPDGVWQPGETILNDSDGDPNTYHGPTEGQGNIYFGELVASQGGITDGFFYAQNNVHMMTDDTAPDIYGVYGFLSAGGVMDLGNRKGGSNFSNFRAKYDQRLEDGSLKLKGIPPAAGGGYAGLEVFTWRELAPGSN